VIETDSHLVISALAGDAAAGGVPFAVAADFVVACEDVVLNPYYQHMGGLYGSEYWTYLLPRRVGAAMAARLVGPPFDPIGAREAVRLGLLDMVFGGTHAAFNTRIRDLAEGLAGEPEFADALERKRRKRAEDESIRSLHAYQSEELARSHECFFGSDQSYHEARHRFVHKLPAPSINPFHNARKERTHAVRPTLRSVGASGRRVP
jgi:putative two-component system hydrogenase maturation factor HypX/HoxX